jgi:hypothetical protein
MFRIDVSKEITMFGLIGSALSVGADVLGLGGDDNKGCACQASDAGDGGVAGLLSSLLGGDVSGVLDGIGDLFGGDDDDGGGGLFGLF